MKKYFIPHCDKKKNNLSEYSYCIGDIESNRMPAVPMPFDFPNTHSMVYEIVSDYAGNYIILEADDSYFIETRDDMNISGYFLFEY